jgi:hypothetical protein
MWSMIFLQIPAAAGCSLAGDGVEFFEQLQAETS